MRKAVLAGLNAMGMKLVGEIKYLIRIPVDYRTGPRGGTIIVRSLPGELPRAEKKRLLRSWKYKFEFTGDTSADVIVYTLDKKAGWLDKGTRRMAARPYRERAIRAAGDLQGLFRRTVQENLKS